MAFKDQVLYCVDCNQEFLFTAGEQEFYEEKGLNHSPKRCLNCRRARKQKQKRFGGGGGGGGAGGRGKRW